MTIECGKGHMYDPGIYSVCPYCNSAQQAVSFSQVPAGQSGRTMPGSGFRPLMEPLSDFQPEPVTPAPGFPGGQPVTSDGKTLAPRGYAPPQEKRVGDENKTIGIMKEKLGIDPVVGWLVCLDGGQKGMDYKLKGQINTIGRSEKMDVCISGDITISSENHARLGYSERNNRFTLIPAESKNYIYLNGEEVFSPMTLNAYDIIEFGKTRLMFVPLCCEKFQWKDAMAGGDDDGAV